MNSRLPLFLFILSLALAACSPGDRGWCRSEADYTPLASAGSGAGLGRITVAPASIAAAVPPGFDKAAAEKLIPRPFKASIFIAIFIRSAPPIL